MAATARPKDVSVPVYNGDRMYGKAEGTWGEGMIRRPNENLYDAIRALMD